MGSQSYKDSLKIFNFSVEVGYKGYDIYLSLSLGEIDEKEHAKRRGEGNWRIHFNLKSKGL